MPVHVSLSDEVRPREWAHLGVRLSVEDQTTNGPRSRQVSLGVFDRRRVEEGESEVSAEVVSVDAAPWPHTERSARGTARHETLQTEVTLHWTGSDATRPRQLVLEFVDRLDDIVPARLEIGFPAPTQARPPASKRPRAGRR